MKILYLNNFFGPFGGAEEILWEEAQAMQASGYQVEFFATNKGPFFIPDYPGQQHFPPYLDFRGLNPIQQVCSSTRPFYNTAAGEALQRALDDLKPDLIHIHNIVYHLTPAVLAVCKRNKIPTLMTLHDTRLVCPSGTVGVSLPYLPAEEQFCTTGSPLACIQQRCKNGSLKETVFGIAESTVNKLHHLYDEVHHFITPSQALYDLMHQRAGIPKNKLTHLDNFITDNYFQAHSTENTLTEGDYFLYIGRLSREKGVHTLLTAMSQISRNIPLYIAGTGPEQEALQQQAENLGLHNVKFLGFKGKDTLPELYRNARASILPCEWFEIFGLTVVESLASGTPVIASRVGALPELLDNGATGCLIPPGDPEALAHSIETLWRNPTLALQLGEAGQIKAQTTYGKARHMERLTQLYEELVR